MFAGQTKYKPGYINLLPTIRLFALIVLVNVYQAQGGRWGTCEKGKVYFLGMEKYRTSLAEIPEWLNLEVQSNIFTTKFNINFDEHIIIEGFL